MPKVSVKSVEELNTARILKQLIDEKGYKTQKAFVQDFNDWLNKKKSDIPPISEKDVSRWTTGTVVPRTNKLKEFAAFFEVNLDYLQGKAYRKQIRNMSYDRLQELTALIPDSNLLLELQHEEQFTRLKAYCETLGFKFEYVASDTDSVTYETEVFQDGKIYTLEVTDQAGSDPVTVITYPDGSTVMPNEEELTDFIAAVNHVLEYEFSKLKKGQ